MEEKQSKTIIFIILLVAGVLLWRNHNTIVAQQSEINDYQSQLDDYQNALDEANNNIDEANGYIEDAQGYAWSSYDEMGQALENLTTVDRIDNP